MEKTYDPQSIEQHWYQTWEQQGWFAPSQVGDDSYCIMIPPPNVTGTLHMGHAFQDTLMDLLIRYQRMQGKKTLWQAGTDHAGIATQMVVERQLAAQGQSRHDLGREAFIDKVWDWKGKSGGTITKQLRHMGASLDWENERFTMDEGLSRAVQEVFIKLYDEGLIYRGKRLVNWDPVLHTAVSDLEVISEEENGHLWHMRYPLTDGTGHLIVATTRPETMLGDTAVAVHPDDERYQSYIGKTIRLPLTQREIPIIADDYVEQDFGSGCVKITPAHDHNDYDMGKRHDLPIINIFTIDAKLNNNVPEAYRGLDRFDARRQIIKDLKQQGLLERIQDHKLMIPRGDRTQAIIEPYLTDQWFVNVKPMAEDAIKAVEDGRIKFVPENWAKTYYEWMRNIEDWCISRQIWWGHRIPAWYDDQGAIYVGRSEMEVREKYNIPQGDELQQDKDVLDTWFSSALWPFSTLGWPDNTERLKTFYPTNVLVTGFDIIFFWVARMIMMGLKFMGDVPFKEVYIHALVRDGEGNKMSKSKGNVLDPLDLIHGIDLESLLEKRTTGLMQPDMAAKIAKSTRKEFEDGIKAYGTDALRFTFAALASPGRDIRFDMNRIEGYRNYCNKLWNASRYVLMNTEGKDTGIDNSDISLSVADRWIISLLQDLESKVSQHMSNYRFDLMAHELYEFTWNEYCGWYLELCKPILTNPDTEAAQQRGTRKTLVRVLEALLRLQHPIMPFITESLWQQVAPLAGKDLKQHPSIMLERFPQADPSKHDSAALADIEWLKLSILGIRRIRAEMDIAPSKPLPVLLQNGNEQDRQRIQQYGTFLSKLAKLDSINWLKDKQTAPESATALVGDLQILIPLAGLIDKAAETQRLQREIAKIDKDLQKSLAKLNNPNFVDRAPNAVVNTEKTRVADMQAAISQLQEKIDLLQRVV